MLLGWRRILVCELLEYKLLTTGRSQDQLGLRLLLLGSLGGERSNCSYRPITASAT